MSSAEIACRKSKTRQRVHKEPPALAVPDINDNANERKRVLNVLAQRRYRERKRQERSRSHTLPVNQTSALHIKTRDNGLSSTAKKDASVSKAPLRMTESLSSACVNPPSLSSDSSPTNIDFDSNESSATEWPATSFEIVPDCLLMGSEDPCLSTLRMETPTVEAEDISLGFLEDIDPITLLRSSSDSPQESSHSDVTEISFPDSYYLPVNELTILRGLLRVALRLRCNVSAIWELGANSPFNDGTHNALTTQELPHVWRPTLSQSSIPHHPVIDLLPWPSVRDRLIMLMSLPDEARPMAATGPLAIAQLAYDLEDAAEGVRIWGDDPCEPTSWEVGQVLFERWWFIFDRQVVNQSNYWRKLRGAAMLSSKS